MIKLNDIFLKCCCTILLCVLCTSHLFSQGKVIDIDAIRKWPSISGCKISTNGKYVIYRTENVSSPSITVTLQSTSDNWKRDIQSDLVGAIEMSSDDQYAVCIKGRDSLVIARLGSN